MPVDRRLRITGGHDSKETRQRCDQSSVKKGALVRAALRGWRGYVSHRRILWRNRIVVSARLRFRMKQEVVMEWYGYCQSAAMRELRSKRKEFIDKMSSRRRHLVVSATFSAWVSAVYRGRMERLRANRAEAYNRRSLLTRSMAALQWYTSQRARLRHLRTRLTQLHSTGVGRSFFYNWRATVKDRAKTRTQITELNHRLRLRRGIRALQRRADMARRRREALQSVICAKARALVIDWRIWTRRRIDKRLALTLMRRALAGWREFTRRRILAEDARVILEMRVSARVKRSTCYEWAVASRKGVAARRFLCAKLAGVVWRKWVQLVRQSCILTAFSTWRRRVLSVPREVDRVRLRRCFKGWLIHCGDLRRAARNGEECRAMRADILRLSVLLSWYRLRMLWEGARRFAAVSLERRAMKQWVEAGERALADGCESPLDGVVDEGKIREARVVVMRLRTAAGLWWWRRWMERRKQQWKNAVLRPPAVVHCRWPQSKEDRRLKGVRNIELVVEMFIALKAAVEQSLVIRYNNSTALFHWADGLCRDVWQQWVSYVHHRHCVNALQHRAGEFLRSAQMRSYLRKYRDRVVSRKIGRGAVRRLLATIE
ncbi:hypothetical protein FOZ63_000290, partial [Perkinsus olseni]